VYSRPAALSHRLTLLARRNPALSAVISGTLVLVTAFAVGMSWLAVQLGHERDQALAGVAGGTPLNSLVSLPPPRKRPQL